MSGEDKSTPKSGEINTTNDNEVDQLKGHIYTYGVPGQAQKYLKTTRAIADYVRVKYGKDMYNLVRNLKETEYQEPDEPAGNVKQTVLKRYEALCKEAWGDQKQYKREKGIVFQIIMQQCHVVMRNKVESLANFPELDENDDVVELLKAIKNLAYSMGEVRYPYWTMQASLKTLVNLQQQLKESLQALCVRFIAQQEMTEDIWGQLVPFKLKDRNETEQNEGRNKFLACLFLAGVDRERWKKVVDDLNNDFVLGKENYPKDVPDMRRLLENRRGGGNKNRYDAVSDGVNLGRSFVQKSLAKIKCFRCGKMGHKAKDCPENQVQDDASEGGNSRASDRSGGSPAAVPRGRSQLAWSGA